MPSYELSRAIHDIVVSRDRALAFKAKESLDFSSYVLNTEELSALSSQDLVGLYGLGAHPLLVFHLSAILNDRSHYVRNVVPKIQGLPNAFYDYYSRRDQRKVID